MIPVLGIPYLNRRDLLDELLASFDHPVERLVLIDNSETNELRDLASDGRVVVATRHNLGVSASWNLIIKSTPLAPWWFIVNSDIRFAPGDMARVADVMESHDGLGMVEGYSAFALTRSVVGRVGFFDENFVPAYYEDNDYSYRGRLCGVDAVDISADLIHHGSIVIRSDPRYRSCNAVTFSENGRYYHAKWGGLPGEEKFSSPFNTGADPRFWYLDFQRLSALTWR